MRKILLALAFFAAAVLVHTPASYAAEGPPSWCAQAKNGTAQCTYFTVQQCLAATFEVSDCYIARGAYLVTTPVSESVVFLLDEEPFRPLCSQVEGGSECMFFMLAQCIEAVQESAACTVKEPTYLVSAKLEEVAGLASE
jgi:hypothetical protein